MLHLISQTLWPTPIRLANALSADRVHEGRFQSALKPAKCKLIHRESSGSSKLIRNKLFLAATLDQSSSSCFRLLGLLMAKTAKPRNNTTMRYPMSQLFPPPPSPWARAVAEMACQIKNVKIQASIIGKLPFARQVSANSTGYCNPSPR